MSPVGKEDKICLTDVLSVCRLAILLQNVEKSIIIVAFFAVPLVGTIVPYALCSLVYLPPHSSHSLLRVLLLLRLSINIYLLLLLGKKRLVVRLVLRRTCVLLVQLRCTYRQQLSML
uniref:Uncharacterized protein n=1 Tax=Cacopsylla melanoneura TaxID=428564 RepID=A0A8D8QVT3_9HEMI